MKDNQNPKKHITLINIGFPTKRDILRFFVPMGVLWLGAYIENAGYSVQVLDYQTHPPVKDNTLPESLGEFLEKADSNLLGISVISKDLPLTLTACEIFKKKYPGKQILLGGPGPSGIAGDLMEKFPFIDFVAVGEGEITLLELLAQLEEENPELDGINGLVWRKQGQVVTNPRRARMRDLDCVPMPAYHLIDHRRYNAMYIFGSRGCSHFCTFCDQPGMWAGQEIHRGVDLMMKELDYLMETLKVQWVISFSDNEFCHHGESFDEFIKLMKKRKYRFPFAIDRRIDAINPGVLKKAKSVGCITLLYGIESGSARILREIRKEFTPERIIPGLNLSARHIMHNMASMMFGYPFEEISDFLDTVNIIWRMCHRTTPNYITFQLHYLSPLPRTGIFAKYGDRLVRRGIVNMMNSGNNFDIYDVITLEKEMKILVLPKTEKEQEPLDPRIEKMVSENPKMFSTFYLYESPRIHLKEKIIQLLKIAAPRKLANFMVPWEDLVIHFLEDSITVSGPPKHSDIPAVMVRLTREDLQNPEKIVDEMTSRGDKTHLVCFRAGELPPGTESGDALLKLLDMARARKIKIRILSYLPDSFMGFSTRLKLTRDYQLPEHPGSAGDLLTVNSQGRVSNDRGITGEKLEFYESSRLMFNAFYGNMSREQFMAPGPEDHRTA